MIMTGVSFSGCYDLDTYPEDKVSTGTFWKTEDHVKQGLMGIYTAMKPDRCFGLHCMFDALGEIADGYDMFAYNVVFLGTYTPNTSWLIERWSQLYDGVQRSNSFIANVSKMNSLDEELKGKYIAEAKFMRALFYFTLMDFYGGVPYYDETTDINADYANMKQT
jgi:hypothetical protein